MKTITVTLMTLTVASSLTGCVSFHKHLPPPATPVAAVTDPAPRIPVTQDPLNGRFIVVAPIPAPKEPKTIVKRVVVTERVLVPAPPLPLPVTNGCGSYVPPAALPVPPDVKVGNSVTLDTSHLNDLLKAEVKNLKRYIANMLKLNADAYATYLKSCPPPAAPIVPVLPASPSTVPVPASNLVP